MCFGRVVLYCSNTRRAAESDCPRKDAVVVARGVGRVPVLVLCLGFVRAPLLFGYIITCVKYLDPFNAFVLCRNSN